MKHKNPLIGELAGDTLSNIESTISFLNFAFHSPTPGDCRNEFINDDVLNGYYRINQVILDALKYERHRGK